MQQYYYAEWENAYGYLPPRQKKFTSDENAINFYKNWLQDKLMVVYKESDTPDGTPFIIVYEQKEQKS